MTPPNADEDLEQRGLSFIAGCCSVALPCPALCDAPGLQRTRLPCPSLSSGVSLVEGMENSTATVEGNLYLQAVLQKAVCQSLTTLSLDCSMMKQVCPRYLPHELKTFVYAKHSPQMFIAALFTNAKYQKQPRYPSIIEWINKL